MGLSPWASTRFSPEQLPKEPREGAQSRAKGLSTLESVPKLLKYWPRCVRGPSFLNLLPLLTGSCVPVSRYGDMRVMMAYELFSMWQNLGRSFLLMSAFHILHSQMKSDEADNFPQVLGMLIQTQEIFTCP